VEGAGVVETPPAEPDDTAVVSPEDAAAEGAAAGLLQNGEG
jgi:hypothetical protein